MPTLNELHRPFRVGGDATAANPDLDPERVWGAELGTDAQLIPGLNFGATLWSSVLDDAITNVTLAQGPGSFSGVGFVTEAGEYRQRRNIEAIDSVGLELRAELDAQPLFGLRGIHLDAAYSHLQAMIRSSAEAAYLSGRRPAQVPEKSLRTSLMWWTDPNAAHLALTLHYMGSRFEDDLEQRVLDDALTLDGTASFALAQGLFLLLRTENITNELVEVSKTSAGLTELAQPRAFWLGLRFRQPQVLSNAARHSFSPNPNLRSEAGLNH